MPPDRHRLFVDHALPLLRADDRILGLAAAGSWISSTMDDHSDIDLVLALRPDAAPAVMTERKAIAARLGPLLAAFTGEHVGEPRLLICLYGPPLLHVDLKFVALSDLHHRVEDPVVLWERDGALTRTMSESHAAWPQPDLQWIEDRFWVWVHYLATKLARGEWFEVIQSLAFIRSNVLAPLAAVAARKTPRGVRHLERDVPEAVEPLRRTLATHDRISCAAAIGAAVDAYVDLRDRLADSSLTRSPDAQREALAFLRAEIERGDLEEAHARPS